MTVSLSGKDRRGLQGTNLCDPVSLWLGAHPDRVQGTRRSLSFAFQGTPVTVSSNSEDVAAYLQLHIVAHYPAQTAATDHPRRCRIDIHIINDGRDRRIILPVGKGAPLTGAVDLPPPRAIVPCEEFVHLRWAGIDSFWRPFNLLVSATFSAAPRVQILATGPTSSVDVPLTCTGPLRARARPGKAGRGDCRALSKDEIGNLVRTMIVRAQGHFCLHAATVASGQRGVLLMGPSGSGKTTTALALLRGGYELQSDENSVLSAANGSIRVAGFRSTPRVVGRRPRTLAELERTLGSRDGHKTQVLVPQAPAHGRQRHWAAPAAMFFLRIQPDAGDHQVVRMPPEEAFVRVTDQVLDPTNVFRREEQALAIIRLIEQCPAYELVLGRRLESLPELVRRVMEGGA